jgi:hypothetical protein
MIVALSYSGECENQEEDDEVKEEFLKFDGKTEKKESNNNHQ